MANVINYQRELIDILLKENRHGRTPRILLHACCAPCASACLEVLDRFADITVFFYNPNITSHDEYEHRLDEMNRFVREMPFSHHVNVMEGEYDPDVFFAMAAGLENEPERGKRCVKCYRLRLQRTAELARRDGYDYFATTLTLSPLKPAQIINEIGMSLSGTVTSSGFGQYGEEHTGKAIYLASDFKKNNGYLRSIEISKQYGLYRQNYCGCIYSK